jgi:hypothetical protein
MYVSTSRTSTSYSNTWHCELCVGWQRGEALRRERRAAHHPEPWGWSLEISHRHSHVLLLNLLLPFH